MSGRILLVSHPMTEALRHAAFPRDEAPESLDGVRELGLPPWPIVHGPELRCRSTALMLMDAREGSGARVPDGSGPGPEVAAALADRGSGAWAGRRLDDVAATDPEGLLAWLTDPAATPAGTESLNCLLARVAHWLDRPGAPARSIAVTHPAVVRAALVSALGAPASSFWRLDVEPGSVCELRGGPGRWSLRVATRS